MSTAANYGAALRESAKQTGSIACMGIDPVIEALPYPELSPGRRVLHFFEPIFAQMRQEKVFPGAFKPNIGYFHALDAPLEGGSEGSRALAQIMELLRLEFPDIPVILDMKRGDIARSSRNYAEEAFLVWKADAVTVSPYMGSDSVGPFLSLAEEQYGGVYVLNRTSNPGAQELQNLRTADGVPLYVHVAQKIISWNQEYGTGGAVVGATSPQELQELAEMYAPHSIPLLIPGVGGQGGNAADTVEILHRSGYPLQLARINSSSGITHPWVKRKEPVPEDWPAAVVANLRKLNTELGNVE